jgi:putative hydrolase of the HAD superfamily
MEPLPAPRTVRGLRSILEEVGVEPELLQAAEHSFNSYFQPIRLFPAVLATLTQLSATYLLGIVSNAPEWQGEKLRHLCLTPLVSCVALSGLVGYEKPDPRIFRYALTQLGVCSTEAVYVGDRLDVDIGGAHKAALRAVWFNHWAGELRVHDPHPEATIERFEQLSGVLAGMTQ